MRLVKVKRESVTASEKTLSSDIVDIEELKKDIHDESANVEEVPVKALRCDQASCCDFLVKSSEGFEKIVEKESIITSKIIETLEKNNHKVVYTPSDQVGDLRKYFESNLQAIVFDKNITKEEKSEIVYLSATDVVENLFSNPITTESITKTRGVVKNILDGVLSDNITINSLIAVSSYDYYTFTHSVDVSVYALGIGKELKMNPKTLNLLAEGAILHDIGKSKIDIKIVNKPGRLVDEEFKIMKQHPQFSYDILHELGLRNPSILTAARDHHEKLNGKGYPNGISGEQISSFARIIAIADIFNALTTRRSYKPALSSFEALKIMKNEMSEELDENILKVFIYMMSGKKI
ncbi:MAG: hypothetical protein QG567_1220 [Campylobacterota bacterium]|nr:hypothetical protein [Campylobacterota bacterium]